MNGFDSNTVTHPSAHAFSFNGTTILNYDNDAITQNIGTFANSTEYKIALVLRSTGAYYFIKGGAFTNWSLLWIASVGATTNLYPNIANRSATSVFTADNIRIPTNLWLPTPLAYDTFTRGDGAIGSSETTGPDSQTTPSLAWTGGAISTNKNVITPSLGSEINTSANAASDPNGNEANATTGITAVTNVVLTSESAAPNTGSYNLKGVNTNPTPAWFGYYLTYSPSVGTWYQTTLAAKGSDSSARVSSSAIPSNH